MLNTPYGSKFPRFKTPTAQNSYGSKFRWLKTPTVQKLTVQNSYGSKPLRVPLKLTYPDTIPPN
jgi:hypothetical protein